MIAIEMAIGSPIGIIYGGFDNSQDAKAAQENFNKDLEWSRNAHGSKETIHS